MTTQESVAIVTGGAQGIGKAIALQLIKENVRVFILDMDKEAGEEFVKEKESSFLSFIHGDISYESFVKYAVENIFNYSGRIDYLINNAAIQANQPMEELSIELWERVLKINLTGPFLLARYCSPYLKEQKGAIINLCSTRAFMSEPHTEAYSASKGGIFSLTHSLAISLGPDVRVNCISPGWIDVSNWQKESARKKANLTREDHQQHPAGRVGKPEDVAAMVSFLLKPENDFITGQNFTVDGGMTRKMIYK